MLLDKFHSIITQDEENIEVKEKEKGIGKQKEGVVMKRDKQTDANNTQNYVIEDRNVIPM